MKTGDEFTERFRYFPNGIISAQRIGEELALVIGACAEKITSQNEPQVAM